MRPRNLTITQNFVRIAQGAYRYCIASCRTCRWCMLHLAVDCCWEMIIGLCKNVFKHWLMVSDALLDNNCDMASDTDSVDSSIIADIITRASDNWSLLVLVCDPTIWQPRFDLPRHGTGTLWCLQKEIATCRHWSVSLWWDPDDVSHCRILSPDKTEWQLILATLCGWRRCFVAHQLWLMTRIREEDWSSRGVAIVWSMLHRSRTD